MISTHFKIGIRNVLKNKGFFILNAGGLIIGLTSVILISLWVHSELSFNKELTNYNTIASVMQNRTFAGEIETNIGQAMQLAPELRSQYESHFKHIVTATRRNDYEITYNKNIVVVDGRFAEPGLTHLLDLKMIKGSKDALLDISSVLISESTSKSIFGDRDPIGKTLKLNSSLEMKVAGVYKDLPENSNFKKLNFIAPWERLKTSQNYEGRLGWGNRWFQVFVQLNEGSTLGSVSGLIKNVVKTNNSKDPGNPELFLFPISKWHLYSEFENGISTGGKVESVKIFSIIGIFILLLACINFINLTTANALKRGKEVGVRKTLGSTRKQLIFQFFTESFLLILFSFCIALALAFILLPQFNTITLKDVSVPFDTWPFWLASLSLIVITAVLSSLYPSVYLSSFRPVKALKGVNDNNKSPLVLRKTLIVTQFVISSVLIIGTLTIVSQINHVKDRPIGFDKDLLVSVPINNDKVLQSFESIQNELLASIHIDQVTASDVKVTSTYTTNGGFDWNGKDPNFEEEFYTIRATLGFGEMIDWEILEGRDFSQEFASDSLAFLVNETAVKYMNLENPIGEFINWGGDENYKIIGVVKDMVTLSPFDPIVPTLYVLHQGDYLNYINIKIASNTDNVEAAMNTIESVFHKYNPENLFTYTFLDDEYQENFIAEKRTAKLVGIFSIVAIFISCLGVLGLSIYMAVQRKKEIGIRKVLGASVKSIWQLLSKQFIVLVIISLLIAMPIGYYLSSQWLLEYSYRIDINFWIFALAGGITIGITIVTVSFQAIKAAIANPVDSLKTE
ncbi:putative FtsX-related transmembrane transport protein [Flavobacteriales bacterium ALC-1]|nr:putative FtsX-related transmembrane transport protein [Flavobacteriales bacterium ALC-1]